MANRYFVCERLLAPFPSNAMLTVEVETREPLYRAAEAKALRDALAADHPEHVYVVQLDGKDLP